MSDTWNSIVPSPALQAIAWGPCVPPAALPPLPESQDINPTSHTHSFWAVRPTALSEIPRQDGVVTAVTSQPRDGAGLKGTVSRRGAGAPRPSGLTC